MNQYTLLQRHTKHFTISFISSAMKYLQISLACTLFSSLPLAAMDQSVEKLRADKRIPMDQSVVKLCADRRNANESLRMHAKTGSLEGVIKSIGEGADINHEDLDARRALDDACEHSHEDVALYLLSLGADPFPTKPIFRNTPLTHAVRGCMPKICKALLKRATLSAIEKNLWFKGQMHARKQLLHLLCCFKSLPSLKDSEMQLPKEVVLKIIAHSEEYVWMLSSLPKARNEKIPFLYACIGQEAAIHYLLPLAMPALQSYVKNGGLLSSKNAIMCAQELQQEIEAWPANKPEKSEYMERIAHIINLVNPALLHTNLEKLMKTLDIEVNNKNIQAWAV